MNLHEWGISLLGCMPKYSPPIITFVHCVNSYLQIEDFFLLESWMYCFDTSINWEAMQQESTNFYQFLYHVTPVVIFQVKY